MTSASEQGASCPMPERIGARLMAGAEMLMALPAEAF
jgi:hypothetical protein